MEKTKLTRLLVNRRDALKGSIGAASIVAGTSGTVATLLSATPAFAQDGREPIGGQPPKGAKPSVKDFDYQIKYQRAFEAVLWNMPAIAIYSLRRAAFTDLGMRDNDIIAYSAPATPKLEAITPNSVTPYIAGYTDLRKGPVILDVPSADSDGSLYGQVVDAWQFTIADIGPSGMDKGLGGKLLFTPPGYTGAVSGWLLARGVAELPDSVCFPLCASPRKNGRGRPRIRQALEDIFFERGSEST